MQQLKESVNAEYLQELLKNKNKQLCECSVRYLMKLLTRTI